MTEKSSFANVRVRESVIASIVVGAVLRVKGVHQVKRGLLGDLVRVLKGDMPISGVTVTRVGEGLVDIDVHLVAEQGADLRELAREVQGETKEVVERVANVAVRKVNVYVEDIHLF